MAKRRMSFTQSKKTSISLHSSRPFHVSRVSDDLPLDCCSDMPQRAMFSERGRTDCTEHGCNADVVSRFPHQGVYLRPTLFMVNATATRLADVLYPSESLPGDEKVDREGATVSPAWWCCQPENSPPLLVSFWYNLCLAVPLHSEGDPQLEEFTDAELVINLHGQHTSDAVQCWRLLAVKRLSVSLRESRLATVRFPAEFLSVGRCIDSGYVTTVLGGSDIGTSGECLPLLERNVEAALRVMCPGEESSFFVQSNRIAEPNTSTLPCGRHVAVSRHHGSELAGQQSTLDQFYHIHIHLCSAAPCVTPYDMPLQRFVFPAPRNNADSGAHMDVAIGSPLYSGRRGGQLSLLHFFCPSLLFFRRCDKLTEELNVRSSGMPSAAEPCANRAFMVAMASLFEGFDMRGFPPSPPDVAVSGLSACASGDMPTDGDAILFLNSYLFTKPKDGATVSISVTRTSALTGREFSQTHLTKALIGSPLLPLWLDVTLQQMQRNERNIVRLHTDCEDDAKFQARLIQSHDYNLESQERVLRESGHTDGKARKDENEDVDCRSTPSSAKSWTDDRSRSSGSSIPLCYDLSCKIHLLGFDNIYRTDDFFFVNPQACLSAVGRLFVEAHALCSAYDTGRGPSAALARVSEEWGVVQDGDCQLDTSRFETVNIFPAQVTTGDVRNPYRGVAKAAHKVYFALLLLSFHVDVAKMQARGVPCALLGKRLDALVACFKTLARLYPMLGGSCASACGVDALSAAIELRSDAVELWEARGNLLAHMGAYASAVSDYEKVRSILEANELRISNAEYGACSLGSTAVTEDTGTADLKRTQKKLARAKETIRQLNVLIQRTSACKEDA